MANTCNRLARCHQCKRTPLTPAPLPSLSHPATVAYRNERPPGYNATTRLTSPPLAWAPPPALAFRGGRIVEAASGTPVRLQVS